MIRLDNRELMNLAIEAQKRAYTPHFRFNVGAAILTHTDKIFCGCNIENPSFCATICAERTAICKMITAGERVIRKIAVVGSTQDFCAPCGICLQAISEFLEQNGKIILTNAEGELKELGLVELYPMPVTKK